MPKKFYPDRKRQFANAALQDLADAFDRPVLGYHYNVGGYKPWPKVSRRYYLQAVRRMKKQGYLKEVLRDNKKFMQLTKKGVVRVWFHKLKQLEGALKTREAHGWWLALFDIPEKEGSAQRTYLRRLLKSIGFSSLQKSVYISPYEVPDELVKYLKVSGMNRFVRFFHVDRADDADDLRRRCAKKQ
ncbi:hypothetical protein HY477_01140 [Candidatus Uhrbacteria bacterium]|nr:hypothetical protein [Candidatus Uhrbacteria bacterium]